ncbi:MAG: hypothetical protein AAF645_24095, partial [Myxococcota bacterium]
MSICVALMAVGCGDDDGGGDGGGILPDVGIDMGMDGGPTFEAGPEMTTNEMGPTETGPGETGMTEMGVEECNDFVPCTAARGCAGSLDCIAAIENTVGGVTDPITDAPAGSEQFVNTLFQDGMCSPQGITTTGSPGACDPDDPEDTTCGSCGGCADLGGVVACFQRCTPNGVDNDVCRDGYTCNTQLGLCIFGNCTQDLDCQVTRVESNGLPGIQDPGDCVASVGGTGDPRNCQDAEGNDVGFDNLVFNAAASCNTDTYECEGQSFNETASGGDICNDSTECEEDGFCISGVGQCEFTNEAGVTFETNVNCTDDSRCTAIGTDDEDGVCAGDEWAGGSCTRFDCDVPGNECANDGICQERGLGVFLCLDGCTVGGGASVDPEDPATWITTEANGGCRDGYSCFWNGVGG